MALRFRKSVRIAPGVRMNIGKRGVSSISAGGFNFGKRGVYRNISIPGTGISYRAKVVGRSKTKPTKSRPSKTAKRMSVAIKLLDDGSVVFTDKKGKPLPDNLIREAKKQNRGIIEQWLQEQSEGYNAEIEALLNIHLTTPAPKGEVIVNPKPEPPKLQKHGLTSKLSDRHRQKVDERNILAQQEYEEALRNWEKAENALKTDTEVMSSVLSSAFASIEWPRETLISFDIVDEGRKVLLDVDLPEIEDMPSQEAKVNRRQLALTIKDRSQNQRRLEYLTHIHAIGFRFVGDVFAHLPTTSQVILSGYSQRASRKTGCVEDEYLYSVRVTREAWEHINFDNLGALDIVECFEQFELRRKVTKTGIISPIEPFEE